MNLKFWKKKSLEERTDEIMMKFHQTPFWERPWYDQNDAEKRIASMVREPNLNLKYEFIRFFFYLVIVISIFSVIFFFSFGEDESLSVADRFLKYLYFSTVTFSTLGYGDITPDGQYIRLIASLEALMGQMFFLGYSLYFGYSIASQKNKSDKQIENISLFFDYRSQLIDAYNDCITFIDSISKQELTDGKGYGAEARSINFDDSEESKEYVKAQIDFINHNLSILPFISYPQFRWLRVSIDELKYIEGNYAVSSIAHYSMKIVSRIAENFACIEIFLKWYRNQQQLVREQEMKKAGIDVDKFKKYSEDQQN